MARHRNTRFFVESQSDVMRHPPHDPKAALLSRAIIGSIAFYGALMTAATLAAFL